MSYPTTSYKGSEFYLNFKKKYAEAKSTNRIPNSSISRIVEFRQKFEKPLRSRPEIQVPNFEIEPPVIFKRPPSSDQKLSHQQSHISNRPANNTENILPCAHAKAKLEDIIPLSVLIEAKSALIAAQEKSVQDLPYLYNFSLAKFSKVFEEKSQRR